MDRAIKYNAKMEERYEESAFGGERTAAGWRETGRRENGTAAERPLSLAQVWTCG